MMHNNKNIGFSLIEILVALIIVSIGILGVLVFQAKNIKYLQEVYQREVVVSATEDLISILKTYKDDLYRVKPSAEEGSDGSFNSYYAELKSETIFYNNNGTFKFKKDACNKNALGQKGTELASCWLAELDEKLPSLNLKNSKICPSFESGKCAGSGYMGSSMEIIIAWDSVNEVCENDLCKYITRVDL